VHVADAFLATLSAEQRAIAQIELKPELAVHWTSFPGGSNVRNSVFYRDLKPGQVEAALKVARVALGEEGFSPYQEVRAADDVLAKGRGGRGAGGPGEPDQKKGGGDPAQKQAGGAAQKKGGPGGGFNFRAANYMIAFLGKPSKTDPWILQLGGHHLAINIYDKWDERRVDSISHLTERAGDLRSPVEQLLVHANDWQLFDLLRIAIVSEFGGAGRSLGNVYVASRLHVRGILVVRHFGTVHPETVHVDPMYRPRIRHLIVSAAGMGARIFTAYRELAARNPDHSRGRRPEGRRGIRRCGQEARTRRGNRRSGRPGCATLR